MNTDKDYYACLGVLPSAENIVIRAAYRALAQRYHPDRFQGDPAEAMRRMQEINEAYEILSDPAKRRQYDEARSTQPGTEEFDSEEAGVRSAFEDAARGLETSWQTAVEYYPDLANILARLKKTSYKLGFAFQIRLLETKRFEDRETLADTLEAAFLKTYFGTNPEIIAFARDLIAAGHRSAARELNKAMLVLGVDVDPRRIISRIDEKHEISKLREKANADRATVALARLVMDRGYAEEAIELLNRIGAELNRETVASWRIGHRKKVSTTVRLWGITKQFDDDFSLAQWVQKEVSPKVIATDGVSDATATR